MGRGCPPLSLQPPHPPLHPQPSACRGRGSSPALCACPPWRGDGAGRCFGQAKAQGDPAKRGMVQQGRAGSQPQVPGDTITRGCLSCPGTPWGARGAHIEVEQLAPMGMCLRGAGRAIPSALGSSGCGDREIKKCPTFGLLVHRLPLPPLLPRLAAGQEGPESGQSQDEPHHHWDPEDEEGAGQVC